MIVDACANYVETLRLAVGMPEHLYPQGAPDASREQFVLLSAKPGEISTNLNAQKMGLFTAELFKELSLANAFPPDMGTISATLAQRFNQLRDEGKASQTPVFYSYRDWNGAVKELGRVKSPSSAARPKAETTATVPQKQALSALLVELPCMLDPQQREAVLRQIGNKIYARIPRHSKASVDIYNIVDTSATYSGGLAELIRAVRTFDPDEDAMTRIGELNFRNLWN